MYINKRNFNKVNKKERSFTYHSDKCGARLGGGGREGWQGKI